MNNGAEGSVNVLVVKTIHPFASVTRTVYVPAVLFDKVIVV